MTMAMIHPVATAVPSPHGTPPVWWTQHDLIIFTILDLPEYGSIIVNTSQRQHQRLQQQPEPSRQNPAWQRSRQNPAAEPSSRQNSAGRTQQQLLQQQQEESNKNKTYYRSSSSQPERSFWYLQLLNYRTLKCNVWHVKTMQLRENR